MKRGSLQRRAALQRGVPLKRSVTPAARRPVSVCTPEQRAKAQWQGCIVSGDRQNVTPAHVISKGFTRVGQDDPRAVVGLRVDLHRLYDTGQLDLLPALEASCREELAFAVERVGLLTTLRRVTNQRWGPHGL